MSINWPGAVVPTLLKCLESNIETPARVDHIVGPGRPIFRSVRRIICTKNKSSPRDLEEYFVPARRDQKDAVLGRKTNAARAGIQ